MIDAFIWGSVSAIGLFVVVAALRRYFAPDERVLERLQSSRYSLFEVVQEELSTPVSRAERDEQIRRVRESQLRAPNKEAAAFLAATARRDRRDDETVTPLFVRLLSRAQNLFALRDIDLVKWVLNDPVSFSRARTLESFADAFRLSSVFTTKDPTLHQGLKRFFAGRTNRLSRSDYDSMMAVLERHVDSMLQTFDGSSGVRFIPKVEGMVLEAYGESFFGMASFPDAEECAVLIKQIWQIKSLRNNVPLRRWNPLLWMRLRRLQRRLFQIIDHAQTLVDDGDSSAAHEMARVYLSNGYSPGNLLNAFIPLYEAIARGVIFALQELASASSLQKELRAEIGRHSGEDLAYCRSTDTLLHRVWKESLRLRPPTPNQTRRVTTTDNPFFPLGSKLVVVWSVFQRDPAVWGPNADEFDPDRWLHVTREQEHNYNPFGSGAQRCVAMQYSGFGGRVILKRIVESMAIENETSGSAEDTRATDRGYSRGPDPDVSRLRFVRLTQAAAGPALAAMPPDQLGVDDLGEMRCPVTTPR